ncbi:ATP-grasp fold amidoligase family protein [Alkalihalobacterium chitinilyticum]|uniref:Teichuronopeptide biosynthesis n=1 Tax=Alkalihalobacterium chitinilyticum TaxID=2980103 RepID=A0ABT5VK35_9BACI|nr:ATP-grasp fold amidoligase family protein [Alkalihalobacterium chitinilyticum]MDE5415818.1 teichuronopeptide biosynthesis [Alkalihalobacterium chitinilyticum]
MVADEKMQQQLKEKNQQSTSPDPTSEEAPIDQQLEAAQEKEQTLLASLLKKETQLQQLQRKHKREKKESKKITQSRTWKYSLPIRKTLTISKKIKEIFKASEFEKLKEDFEALQQSHKALQSELNKTNEALVKTKEQNTAMKIELGHVNSKELHQQAKKAKENGEVIEYIDQLVKRKNAAESHYGEALTKTARLFNKEKPASKQIVFSHVLKGFQMNGIPEFIVRAAENEGELTLTSASSFSASLSRRARVRQLREHTPELLLDNKVTAYTFADQLGVRRPWVRAEKYKLVDLPIEAGIVIKPSEGAGSRGVYLVISESEIYDVRRSNVLPNWEALKEQIAEDLASGAVTEDEWLIEELILGESTDRRPAKDLKFYCFYGKVALILEITRFPNLRYCWWNANGERISTGKYDDQLFTGEGATQAQIDLAASISAEIPTPFIRIDFLKSSQELIFGEFTPKPGNYDEFNRKTDQWLGDYYLEAEERLIQDLLNGKSFDKYKKIHS